MALPILRKFGNTNRFSKEKFGEGERRQECNRYCWRSEVVRAEKIPKCLCWIWLRCILAIVRIWELRWSVFDVSGSCLIYKVSGNEILKKFSLESGIHRVQRVPETESRGRRHTSTIAVAVLPFITFDPQYKESDFKIECKIGSGKGGQHKNKTMSAVRVTHIVSGITACIDSRCQHTNKQDAMAVVLSRLKDRDRNLYNNSANQDRVSQIGNMGRSGGKIRTYNFIDGRVKDERIGKKFRTKDIMSGKLELLYDCQK